MSARDDVFRAAAEYHGAVARLCRARRDGADVEETAQLVVGTALRYRSAIEALTESERERARRRLSALRSILRFTSEHYNIAKRLESRG